MVCPRPRFWSMAASCRWLSTLCLTISVWMAVVVSNNRIATAMAALEWMDPISILFLPYEVVCSRFSLNIGR